MASDPDTLKAMSDAATEGPMFLHDFAHPAVSSAPGPQDVTISCDDPATITIAFMGNGLTASLEEARANARFFVRLWNDYREGRLVSADDMARAVEGMREQCAKVARGHADALDGNPPTDGEQVALGICADIRALPFTPEAGQ